MQSHFFLFSFGKYSKVKLRKLIMYVYKFLNGYEFGSWLDLVRCFLLSLMTLQSCDRVIF